ncbi:MAG: UDP-N-acetylglucosamine 1-carboxyvinyltransferase [Elusimicrobia bacterium]|jgi:UDP-N-acetylglucosamine 1-carboxyvinyltransferase|nr:UDP-N-acetylglucosamine 1-carboxyvinyltransferase [Elusimicrobiota bacterium]
MVQKKNKLVINGPAKLKGHINIAGSKNAVLPILAATLISDKRCIIENVPDLSDIADMISVLSELGKEVSISDETVIVDPSGELKSSASYDLIKKMRASVLVMGALTGRKKFIKVALPGGCAIGARPIDMHLGGFKKLGLDIKVSGGFVELKGGRLKGTRIYLDYPSVGATENLIMAACRADGETWIENASVEPEVLEVIRFLKAMGVWIKVDGPIIKVKGRKKFKKVKFAVMDDRIQAGTYLMAGCLPGSEIEIKFSHPEVLETVIDKLQSCGASISVADKTIKAEAPKQLKSIDITTAPYPGFPTDLQAPFSVLMALAEGVSVINEEIFENRFMHCPELLRMGAKIEVRGGAAIITGSSKLTGAPVAAADLRGGAALVLAGLAAQGRTEINEVSHIFRGYDEIENKFKNLGADIWME